MSVFGDESNEYYGVTYYAQWYDAVYLYPMGGTITATYNGTSASAGETTYLKVYAKYGYKDLWYRVSDTFHKITKLESEKTGATHNGYYLSPTSTTQTIGATSAYTLNVTWVGTTFSNNQCENGECVRVKNLEDNPVGEIVKKDISCFYAQWYDQIRLYPMGGTVTATYNGTTASASGTGYLTIYAKVGEKTLYYKSNSNFYAITKLQTTKTGYESSGTTHAGYYLTPSSTSQTIAPTSAYVLNNNWVGTTNGTHSTVTCYKNHISNHPVKTDITCFYAQWYDAIYLYPMGGTVTATYNGTTASANGTGYLTVYAKENSTT